ncbi:MAG: ATP-binding protein [Clostridiales bacterium]|nr:ATP-binding protein [Clostridiales bacterium]
MNRIDIKNFGPINEASVDLDKNIQVLIGTQASGKSTICKIVYFCQKIRDYTLDFLMNAEQFTQNHRNEYYVNYLKYLTRQFMGCFGTTIHMQKFSIVYQFGDKNISIRLNKDGYVRFTLSKDLRDKINVLICDAAAMYSKTDQNSFDSIIDKLTAMVAMKGQLSKLLSETFGNSSEIIYIPAGRSLLATLSEQLQDFPISDMDLTMQEFIRQIRITKSKFGSRIPDIVRDYTKTVRGQINNHSVEQAYGLIQNILKADYMSENDGERIYYDERHWVKLMYASSGQQEALWILMLCFMTILEKKNSFFIIEEPEAHLFPVAQKDIVNLIALMVNTTGSKAIITTHSPYILTSFNILLYSGKVEGRQKTGDGVVIHRDMRLFYDGFAAYKLENISRGIKRIESIMDEESHMIYTDYIDEVSNITNNELERLLDVGMNQ